MLTSIIWLEVLVRFIIGFFQFKIGWDGKEFIAA